MKKYFAFISEISYIDNYNEGEVDDTFNLANICEKKFDSIEDALKFFKDNYEYNDDYKMELVDTSTFICSRPMMNSYDYGFLEASEGEMIAFKNGDINLWNVEYQMKIYEISEISEDELEEAFKKVKN